jgi:hypothetical protein
VIHGFMELKRILKLVFNNRMTQWTLRPGTYFDVTDSIPGFVALKLWTETVIVRQGSCESVAAQRVYNRLE